MCRKILTKVLSDILVIRCVSVTIQLYMSQHLYPNCIIMKILLKYIYIIISNAIIWKKLFNLENNGEQHREFGKSVTFLIINRD